MSKLNINRDQPQPSDKALLKRMDFEKVLQDAGEVSVDKTIRNSETPSPSFFKAPTLLWMMLGIVVLALGVVVFNYRIDPKKELSKTHPPQDITLVSVKEETKAVVHKTEQAKEISEPKTIDDPSFTMEVSANSNYEVEPTVLDKSSFEPPLASGLVFNFEENFDMKLQYQKFAELAPFPDLKFQPIGDFEPSILDVSWDEAILSKQAETYRLQLVKKGNTLYCDVVPVVEKPIEP